MIGRDRHGPNAEFCPVCGLLCRLETDGRLERHEQPTPISARWGRPCPGTLPAIPTRRSRQ